MRTLVVMVAGLMLLSAVPFTTSQQTPTDTAGALQVLEDSAGDAEIVIEDGGSQSDGGNVPQADLIGAWVDESQEEFEFRIQVASLADDDAHLRIVDDVYYDFRFISHDLEYRLLIDYRVKLDTGEPVRDAQLEKLSDAGEWDYETRRPVYVDADEGTLSTWVNRDNLPDTKGASPFPDRFITDFWVTSYGNLRDGAVINFGNEGYGAPATVTDRMPDDGASDVKWPVQFGLEQLGHVALKSNDPVRTSNGEASTFVFPLRAINNGDSTDIFDLRKNDIPNGWDITFPQPSLVVDPGAEVETAVLLTTPFEHNHGAITTFLVEAESRNDPSAKGKVEFGLRYTETPQPTGHHSEQWWYSSAANEEPIQSVMGTALAGNDGEVFFNAAGGEEGSYDADDGVPVRGIPNWDEPGADAGTYSTWTVPLKPSLSMGLDFDMNGVGTLEVPIQSDTPMNGATLSGELIHRDKPGPDATETVLVALEPQSEDLAPGQQKTFQFDLEATPESDLLLYQQGASMYWKLTLEHGRNNLPLVGADTPYIQPGGYQRLPLLEYQDPVDDLFSTLSAIKLIANDGQERFVNPGATAIFEVTLESEEQRNSDFQLGVYGSERDWATLPLGDVVTVDASGKTSFPVVVTVPDDAVDGNTADLIVEAVSKQDENTRTLVRIVAVVDTDETWPDDAADAQLLSGQEEESPGLPVLGALAVLGALGLARRRDS